MNKKVIPVKSRKENKGADIAEMETQSLARAFALMTGFTVAFLCFLFHDLKAGTA